MRSITLPVWSVAAALFIGVLVGSVAVAYGLAVAGLLGLWLRGISR